jgi:hypothetical protein
MYLCIKYRYNTREDNVRNTIIIFNIPGTESRREGPNKGRKGGEFVIPGPD